MADYIDHFIPLWDTKVPLTSNWLIVPNSSIPLSLSLLYWGTLSLSLILHRYARNRKRLSRYPQLFSRVGFVHTYRPLQNEELTFVLTRRWHQLGLELDDADFTDVQAVSTIVRITGGNFRLLNRLFVQIGRILRLNGLNTITDDVVKAACSVLVIGDT